MKTFMFITGVIVGSALTITVATYQMVVSYHLVDR